MEKYKNPIHFFKIDPDRMTNLDLREIRRIKREWLAEIELSDSGFISHEGQTISKNDIIHYSEQLASEQELPFYLEMTKWPQLEKFLATGHIRYFRHAESKQLPQFPFLEILSPYFCPIYSRALSQAFRTKKWRKLMLLKKARHLIPSSWQHRCYGKTMGLIVQEKEETRKKLAERNNMLYANDLVGPIDWQTAMSLRQLPSFFTPSVNWQLMVRRQWVKLKLKGIFRGTLRILLMFFLWSLTIAFLCVFIYYQSKGF